MSLIKIAFSVGPFLPTIFGARAAKSGNPFKYIFSRVNSHVSPRRHLQRTTLSMLANSEAALRKGRVQDSTKLVSSVADAYLGQMGKLGIGLLEDVHKSKSLGGRIGKYALNRGISNQGKFRVHLIERDLNKLKKLHDNVEKYKNTPMATIGTASGGAIGYASSNDEHKKRNTIKGALIGGSLGMSLKKGVKAITESNAYKSFPKMHEEYFKDNYWRTQLQKANTGGYRGVGKLSAKLLTSSPEKSLARIKSSEAVEKLFGDKITSFKQVKNNFKDAKDKIIVSFKSPEKIRQYYSNEG